MKKSIYVLLLILVSFRVSYASSILKKQSCEYEKTNLLINVTQKVKNGLVMGLNNSYWAMADFLSHIKVWETDLENQYCAEVSYEGKFEGIKGQPSPAGGHVLDGDENGKFYGGYIAQISGRLWDSLEWADKGSLGTVDVDCNIEDFSCVENNDWVSKYFSEYTLSHNWAGWIFDGKKAGTWINTVDEQSGDIF